MEDLAFKAWFIVTLPTGLGKESALQPKSRQELPRTEQENTGREKNGNIIRHFIS